MKKKVLLVEHWGAHDIYGEPIGHTLKAVKEYGKLLKRECNVSVAMPQHMIIKVQTEEYDNIHVLPYGICEKQPKGFGERIIDKLKIFSNIRHVRKLKDYDIVWYIRSDFFLLVYYLFCSKRKEEKTYNLVCQNEYGSGVIGKILYFIYKKAVRKFDGIIYTQRDMNIPNSNTFYMPDYLYSEEKYGKYRRLKKEEKVVCLGTMNSDKDIESLVDVFNENGYKLEIVGRFLDEDRFWRLKNRAKSNILIENKVLSYGEYYMRMGSAKFSIMPYNMNAYAGRTSGVLQESIYVGSIPIAPKLLLDKNQMPGIGYKNSIAELKGLKWNEIEVVVSNEMADDILSVNDQNTIRKCFEEFIISNKNSC